MGYDDTNSNLNDLCASDPFYNTTNEISQVFQSSFVGMISPIMERVMENISNTVLNSIDDGAGKSSNYMLKSEIVPPIYPYYEKCEMCNQTNGVCYNCGGQGGNGTYTINANGQISRSNVNGTSVPQTNQTNSQNTSLGGVINNTVGTAGNVANTALGTASNALDTTLGTAGNALNTVGNTVGNVANAAGNTVGSLANTVGGVANTAIGGATALGQGIGDLANNIVDEAGNILDKAGNIIGNIANINPAELKQSYNNADAASQMLLDPAQGGAAGSNPLQPGQTGVPGPGGASGAVPIATTPIAGNDIHSAFGALVQKGGDFMPLSSDFSNFVR
jgi:hypothetical protein